MKVRLLYALALAIALPMAAQAAVSVSINIAPPLLPVYVQPAIPAPGYIWTPGYWAWDPAAGDYYWVPGTWVAPPAVGLLWTPGYWGWGGGGYFWHAGYWGPHIGFYGGVNYGFGYTGVGYHGGYWRGGVFNYNRGVNNINTTIVRNVYNEHVVENHERVSFNGGQGGIAMRESAEERAARGEHHFAPTPMQRQHAMVAMRTPEQRASFNHGAPTMAAMARPSMEHGPAVARAPAMHEGTAPRMEGKRVEHGVPPPPRTEARHVERGGPPAQRMEGQHVERAGPAPRAESQHVERGGPAPRVETQHVERGGPAPRAEAQHVERGGPAHEGGGRGGERRGGPGGERER